jgi:hypothetical protein
VSSNPRALEPLRLTHEAEAVRTNVATNIAAKKSAHSVRTAAANADTDSQIIARM